MEKETIRRYRCAACGETFDSGEKPEKCPKCRCRVLFVLEGEPLPRQANGCSPSG